MVLAQINLPDPRLRSIIILIALVTIVIFSTSPLRFGAMNDVGIIWYNTVVLIVVILGIPLRVLLPVFIVDPVACIVGMLMRSRRWYRNKTVFGTFAAIITSYFCLYYVKEKHHRMLLTFIIPITEGIMDKNDNIGISLVVLSYYWVAQMYKWPIDFYLKCID
ncbi:hypothetical protein X943_004022 [Babesia divergens]|uniref:Uncharacterized protein n=1 Tax=Babesia divergens TaxID=32595 RepID=A0AAD9GDQ7_BABDI|nr:hypothetical protein X943_004022 [Babesia divergens]